MDNNLFENVLASEHPEIILESAKPFMELMMYYRCAMKEIQTKLEILDAELSMHSRHNPFESIKCRIKGPMSIINKMKRKNLGFSLKNIEENIFDVAGVRVICSFKSDIYKLAENLMNQDDVTVCEIKDYIKSKVEKAVNNKEIVVKDVNIITFLIYKMYIALIIDWNEDNAKLDEKDIADNVLQILKYGIKRKEVE